MHNLQITNRNKKCNFEREFLVKKNETEHYAFQHGRHYVPLHTRMHRNLLHFLTSKLTRARIQQFFVIMSMVLKLTFNDNIRKSKAVLNEISEEVQHRKEFI